ncbi:MAG: DUF1566 domain-containing protein [Verrucomicrobiota bacterium]
MSTPLDLRKKDNNVKVVEKIITITKKRSFLEETAKVLLTIVVASGVIWGVSQAGSLIPPAGSPSKTMYTLNDIYTLVTTGTTTASTDFTTPGEATSTFHTLEDIVRDYVKPAQGGGAHNPNTTGPFVSDGQADNGWLDQNTGLIWQNADAGQYLCWDENQGCGPMQAKEYCQYLDADGVTVDADPQNIWRLPTVKEWSSVLDYSMQYPATALPNTQSDYYWSSTEYAPWTAFAWYVSTYDGSVDGYYKYNGFLVRCVR